ncbi:MAG: hypothetical protein ACE5GS_12145 [Kiloniellaceae bacterium]
MDRPASRTAGKVWTRAPLLWASSAFRSPPGANMRRVARGILAAVGLVGAWAPAHAGHGVAHYPSYYPHEIRIDVVDAGTAATLFENKALHAYVGSAPNFGGNAPAHVKFVESLDSLLILEINPASKAFGPGANRCAAARRVLAALPQAAPGFVFHPHPVTPFHADYLHHLDRIDEAKAALRTQRPITGPLKFRAKGRRAQGLVQSRWTPAGEAGEDWDASLEEVPLRELMAAGGVPFNGRLGPPWMKQGWFQANRLLASAVRDPEQRRTAEAIYERLVRARYTDLAERVNLQRSLIENLTRGCDRMVAGYTVRREFFSDEFSTGVENIAFDSQLGLNSPVFVRTVKLKDFPWNGWLRLGVGRRPEAAWNPVAGFSDAAGRLVWSALADPALIPLPYNASWVPNRTDFTLTRPEGQSGGVIVPPDAVLPEAGTGALRPVGKRKFAAAKIVYRVIASPFNDGTEMEIADLLYPFIMAYRWGVRANPDDRAYDPSIEPAARTLRGRLMGVRAVRVEQQIKPIAPGFDIVQRTPVVEVYVTDVPGDSQQVAALAPPWGGVPWHLLALMEQAVERGYAAFSKQEAARRGVAWLDLARDPTLRQRLSSLIEEFERDGYRPAALADLVTAEAARARWRALREFVRESGHLLVTNGPYRLKEWNRNSVVVQAVREATYPMGFGTFDRYVHPPRGIIRKIGREADRVAIRVEVEMMVRDQRSYKTVHEPLTRETSRGLYGVLVVSRELVIGPNGRVVSAGKMRWAEDGRFVVDLPKHMPSGRYTVLAAIYLDGNSLNPSTGVLRFQADGS